MNRKKSATKVRATKREASPLPAQRGTMYRDVYREINVVDEKKAKLIERRLLIV